MSYARPLLLVCALIGLATSAQAGDNAKMPRLINCSSQDLLVCYYNGDDSIYSFTSGDSKASVGETVKAKCDGNGKQRCKVAVTGWTESMSCSKAADNGVMKADFKSTYRIVRIDGKYDLVEVDQDERSCN